MVVMNDGGNVVMTAMLFMKLRIITNNENTSLIVVQLENMKCEVLANKHMWLMRYLDFMSNGGKPLFQITTFFITCTHYKKVYN